MNLKFIINPILRIKLIKSIKNYCDMGGDKR